VVLDYNLGVSNDKGKKTAQPGVQNQEVVLEVLRETGTVAEIAKWKKSFLEKAPGIFSSKKSDREKSGQQLESELYKKIGQLQIEMKNLPVP
jgi:plasmid rolling circle replication initiator protein Rep